VGICHTWKTIYLGDSGPASTRVSLHSIQICCSLGLDIFTIILLIKSFNFTLNHKEVKTCWRGDEIANPNKKNKADEAAFFWTIDWTRKIHDSIKKDKDYLLNTCQCLNSAMHKAFFKVKCCCFKRVLLKFIGRKRWVEKEILNISFPKSPFSSPKTSFLLKKFWSTSSSVQTRKKRQTERPKSWETDCEFLKWKMFQSNKAQMFNLCMRLPSIYLYRDVVSKNGTCPVYQQGTKPSVYVFNRILEFFWMKYNTMHENQWQIMNISKIMIYFACTVTHHAHFSVYNL